MKICLYNLNDKDRFLLQSVLSRPQLMEGPVTIFLGNDTECPDSDILIFDPQKSLLQGDMEQSGKIIIALTDDDNAPYVHKVRHGNILSEVVPLIKRLMIDFDTKESIFNKKIEVNFDGTLARAVSKIKEQIDEDFKSIAERSPILQAFKKTTDEDAHVENPRRGEGVLIVDGNMAGRSILKSLLDQRYSLVDTVSGPEDALLKIQEGGVGLVCLDTTFKTPFSSIELCKKIKKANKNILVVALTPKENMIEKSKMLRAGADSYLERKSTPVELFEALTRLEEQPLH